MMARSSIARPIDRGTTQGELSCLETAHRDGRFLHPTLSCRGGMISPRKPKIALCPEFALRGKTPAVRPGREPFMKMNAV